MARGQHRFRHLRLLGEQKIRASAKAYNGPKTEKETVRRDARMKT